MEGYHASDVAKRCMEKRTLFIWESCISMKYPVLSGHSGAGESYLRTVSVVMLVAVYWFVWEC